MLCCCVGDPWVDVAKKLSKSKDISYWIGWKEDEQIINTTFKDVSFHDIDLAWKGEFPFQKQQFDKREGLSPFFFNDISFEELIGLKMIERLDPDQFSFTFNERQDFLRKLFFDWYNVLVREEISLIIAPSIPHRVFDYVIYVLSKKLKIEYITFKMTSWPGYILPTRSIESISFLENNELLRNERLPLVVEEFCERITSDYKKAEPYYMRQQKTTFDDGLVSKISKNIKEGKVLNKVSWLFNDSLVYWKKKDKLLSDSYYLNIEKIILKSKGNSSKKKLRNHYWSLCEDVDFNLKYIFFGLHYQPEETSCPSGGIFVDQKLVIESLIQATNDDTFIYVKEHISQFHPEMEGETGRSKHFYDYFKRHPRVKFIKETVNSFELIDNALAVVTLTGTIGIEAALRGKPVIVFGYAWYRGVSNVFYPQSLEELRKIIKEAEVIPAKSNVKTIKEELFQIFDRCLEAYHYKGYKSVSQIPKDVTVDNLFKFLNGI